MERDKSVSYPTEKPKANGSSETHHDPWETTQSERHFLLQRNCVQNLDFHL